MKWHDIDYYQQRMRETEKETATKIRKLNEENDRLREAVQEIQRKQTKSEQENNRLQSVLTAERRISEESQREIQGLEAEIERLMGSHRNLEQQLIEERNTMHSEGDHSDQQRQSMTAWDVRVSSDYKWSAARAETVRSLLQKAREADPDLEWDVKGKWCRYCGAI